MLQTVNQTGNMHSPATLIGIYIHSPSYPIRNALLMTDVRGVCQKQFKLTGSIE